MLIEEGDEASVEDERNLGSAHAVHAQYAGDHKEVTTLSPSFARLAASRFRGGSWYQHSVSYKNVDPHENVKCSASENGVCPCRCIGQLIGGHVIMGLSDTHHEEGLHK